MSKVEAMLPQLRFEGFSGDWVTVKLKDISEHIEYGLNAKAIPFDGINKYIRITDIDDKYNYFKQGNLTSPGIDLQKHEDYLLQERDILFARTGASTGKSYLYKNRDGRVYFAGFLIRARIKETSHAGFVFQNTRRDSYLNFVTITSQRSGQPGINASEYGNWEFTTPSLDEQTKIGELFQKLDRAIELQQQKVEQSERYKKAMLQKMFPQKGETEPQLRFEGFSGEWRKSKLGQLVAIFRGLVYKPENVVRDGSADSIRVLRSSNIDEDVLVLREDDVFVQADAVNIENVKQGDILITAANGSSRLVGKHAVIKESLAKTVHGGFMLIARTDFPYFINAWMGAVEYQKMLQLAQGGNGAIGNLSKKILDNCEITLPKDIEEQTKIGEFFQTLDARIEAETKKLNHYESLKKAMLQRMFV